MNPSEKLSSRAARYNLWLHTHRTWCPIAAFEHTRHTNEIDLDDITIRLYISRSIIIGTRLRNSTCGTFSNYLRTIEHVACEIEFGHTSLRSVSEYDLCVQVEWTILKLFISIITNDDANTTTTTAMTTQYSFCLHGWRITLHTYARSSCRAVTGHPKWMVETISSAAHEEEN